jgi:hypothetical protein
LADRRQLIDKCNSKDHNGYYPVFFHLFAARVRNHGPEKKLKKVNLYKMLEIAKSSINRITQHTLQPIDALLLHFIKFS